MLGLERRGPGRRVDHHHGPGEDVGRRRQRLPVDLLGSHEHRRPDHAGRPRDVPVEVARDAEVDDAGAVRAEDDVGRLDVPVHQARLVDRQERRHRADGEPVQRRPGERALDAHVLGQRRPGDELADDVRCRRLQVGRQHAGGAERRHPPRGRHLLAEPRPRPRVGQPGRVEGLDGDEPRGVRVPLVDDALPARPQPPVEPVAGDLLRIGGCERRDPHAGSSPGRARSNR